MSLHHEKGLTGQRSSLLVLLAILKASAAIPPQASADKSLSLQGEALVQQDPIAVDSRSHSRFPQKSTSRLPTWSDYLTPAEHDRNLHYDRFAQHLKIQHTPPPSNILSEPPIGTIDDDNQDSEHKSYYTELNHHPVPTKWLMLGYSRVADIPTSLPPRTMSQGHRGHHWFCSATTTLLDPSMKGTMTPFEAAPERQGDWMQKPQAQLAGALTLFLILVFLIQCFMYLWRRCCQSGKGKLALEGDEKQLRAFAEGTWPEMKAASTGVMPTL